MRKFMLFVLLLLCYNIVVFAQTMRVTGRITDSNGRPVENASVLVKGNRTGVTTNSNGEYTISADKGQTLVISSVGYTQQEVVVAEATLNLSLAISSQTLSDVVVIGYGTQRRTNLTGSVVALNNEDLSRRQVASTSSLLQGLAPGVTVTQQSGKPGADGGVIRIRGIGSAFAGQAPLVVVDGVVSSLDNLDPNTIESLTILKDAASTAIYGSRASNGVIVVKTKRAKGKGVTINYNNFFTWQQPTNIPETVNAIEFMEYSNIAKRNQSGNANDFVFSQAIIDKYKTTAPNNLDVFDNNWKDLLLTNSGFMQNHNVNATIGGEKLSMFASASYLKQEGLVPNNSYNKYDIRLNPDLKINDKLSFSGVFGYTEAERIEPAGGSPEFLIRMALGLPANAPAKFGPDMYGDAGQSNRRNPLAIAEASGTYNQVIPSLLSKLSLNYKPVRNLDVELSWAREAWMPHTKTFTKNVNIYQPNAANGTYTLAGFWPGTNSLSESYSTNVRKTYLAQATYGLKVGESDFKLLAGAQAEDLLYNGISAGRTNFINQELPYLNLGTLNQSSAGGASENALAGFYGRFNYSYKDKYLLEVNGRYDGGSRFSQEYDRQWGFFPSASAGWVFTNESFLSGLGKYLTSGKLRASWGSLGNQGLSENYPFAANYASGNNYYFNSVNNAGVAIVDVVNPLVSWETGTQKNFGLDLKLKHNLTITADYFVRTVNDMLFAKPLPNYVPLASPFENVGSMENKGWELTATYSGKVKDLGINVTAMVSDVKNKLTSLPGIPYLDEGLYRSQVGEAFRSYYGYKAEGYFQSAEDIAASPTQFFVPKPGDIKYADIDGNKIVDANDRVYLGNSFPSYEYSSNIILTYKNFDLNLFVQGVAKKENYISGNGAWPFYAADFNASLLKAHTDTWTPENPNAKFPRLLPTVGPNQTTVSSFWVANSAYARLKNVNLGYKLSNAVANRLKLNSARFFVSAQNLFTITKFWEGFDPELNNNNAQFYPLMKTCTVGLNIGF